MQRNNSKAKQGKTLVNYLKMVGKIEAGITRQEKIQTDGPGQPEERWLAVTN